jgi:hypothetical protein
VFVKSEKETVTADSNLTLKEFRFWGVRCKAKESPARRLVIAAALTTLVPCRPSGHADEPENSF